MQAETPSPIRILGIDPGTHITGIGIIDVVQKKDPVLCYYGTVKTKRSAGLPVRLQQINHGLIEVINEYKKLLPSLILKLGNTPSVAASRCTAPELVVV